MQTYQTPLKNPAAASLSLLIGLVVIVAIALSLRVVDSDRLSQEIKLAPEETPAIVAVPEEPLTTQNNIEQQPPSEKQRMLAQPVDTANGNSSVAPDITTPVPKTQPTATSQPVQNTPVPVSKKPNRTTKTS